MKTIRNLSIFIVALCLLGFCTLQDLKTETLKDCKVLDLEALQVIKSSSTNFRYLVITNKGTFLCRRSILNGKFDESNTFFRLKEGKTYDFKVCGYGKGFFFDYRKIIEFKKKD